MLIKLLGCLFWFFFFLLFIYVHVLDLYEMRMDCVLGGRKKKEDFREDLASPGALLIYCAFCLKTLVRFLRPGHLI